MIAPRAPWWGLIVLLPLAACGPATTPNPSAASPPAAASPSAAASPTPTLAAQVGRPLVAAEAGGLQLVQGIITNQADLPVRDLELALEVLGPSGERLAAGRATSLLPWLAPGGAGPYRFTFRADQAATRAEIQLVGYTPADLEPAEVEVGIERTIDTVDGGSRVVGWLDSRRANPVAIDGLVLASFDGGALDQIGFDLTYLNRLPAGRRVPFEATFLSPVKAVDLVSYSSARLAEALGPARLTAALEPGLQLDTQGTPFLVGELVNGSDQLRAAETLIAIADGDGLQRVLAFPSSIPLLPGEHRPFGLARLGLPAGTDPQGLHAQAYVGGTGRRTGEPIQLISRVDSFERIGGSAFLRGTVENQQGSAVADPTVFASVRSTEGDLWSAQGMQVSDRLEPGAVAQFVLQLPLPADADLAHAEFDLRALGLPENQGS
jgi:hypothetical protein